ncbi:SDR family NAD(P)-dependent oxidoreductase [Georgenia sp. Z1344]|uniref:SDR family NAD(P)-dependent oxidoreductase n=1 Tax=Georgenia sp. Z1344 TaxID=3416706 RepID=UPI003CE89800
MSAHDLSARTVLVAGGTGNVGEGIVRALLTSGARVVVPSARPGRLAELRELLGAERAARLELVDHPYESFDDAAALADRLADHGLTDAVAAIGGWHQGEHVWELTEETWRRDFLSTVTTHVALARAFVRALPADGSYTFITGTASVEAVATAGPVSMAGAAQLMLRQVVSAEAAGSPRAVSLVLGPIVSRSRPQGKKEWLTADQAGEAVAHVVATPGLRDETIAAPTVDALEGLLGATA